MKPVLLLSKAIATPIAGAKVAPSAPTTRLHIGESNDAFEREADRSADRVMAVAPSKLNWSVSKMDSRLPLRRKCTCGGNAGSNGECDECRKKRLQRKTAGFQSSKPTDAVVPTIVNEVLRSPGQPLDAATRGFMEPRFGHDFSQVRVFADSGADTAAQAVQARAYTHGRNIVFGAGEYAPGTGEGKKLLAHELTHVIQQSKSPSSRAANQIGPANDPAEVEADRMAERVTSSEASIASGQIAQKRTGVISKQAKPGPVNCPAGQHGAPADAEQTLGMLEVFAMLATVLANAELSSLQLEAVLPGLGAKGGYTMPTGPKMQHYTIRFGLPPAAGGGKFKNRLSGATFPSQAQALVEETKSLQDRYSKIADFLGGSSIRFRCITNPTTVGNCTADCSLADAFGCPTVIMLCPNFWNLGLEVQSQLLIHEVAHTIFGISHGHNFTHADCYAAYAADARGIVSKTGPPCAP
jgi:hypothetical protein